MQNEQTKERTNCCFLFFKDIFVSKVKGQKRQKSPWITACPPRVHTSLFGSAASNCTVVCFDSVRVSPTDIINALPVPKDKGPLCTLTFLFYYYYYYLYYYLTNFSYLNFLIFISKMPLNLSVFKT